ncbi:MAG: hypothetical protein D6706_01480 [Chloroflexi bacterium]|nr:MAG: hypothetical protein D6706_01480 [Chloroflexota bacterium]
MSTKPKILQTKPGEDPDRRKHQAQVKEAIVEGQDFGLTYLLARVKDHRPYGNYRVPNSISEFEFTVKGVVRLEMMGHKVYRGWRRLFGSNTKARDISNWRSRVLIKAFASLSEARAYIKADPLFTWSNGKFPWPDNLPENDWYVLFQVQDVLIGQGKYRWANSLAVFLQKYSALLELVVSYDILPPPVASEGNNA